MAQPYLTPRGEYEVAGQLVTIDVMAEVRAQYERLRRMCQPNVLELSSDAYDVLYMQVCDRLSAMGQSCPLVLREYGGMPIREAPGLGVIRMLHEEVLID